MKRYIYAMGQSKPADVVPAHNEYYPSLKLGDFRKIAKIATTSGNARLLNGLIQLVIDDINADNAANQPQGQNNVPNADIRKFYHPYYDAIAKLSSPIASANLLRNLRRLV